MIALLLAWGGKLLARPAILVGVLSAVAIGGLTIKAKIDKGRHEKAVATLNQAIATRDITIANQSISIGQERMNVTMALAKIDERNHVIETQALKLKNTELQAGTVAKEAFSKGLAAAKELASPTSTVPSDAPGMNAWQRCRLLGECAP